MLCTTSLVNVNGGLIKILFNEFSSALERSNFTPGQVRLLLQHLWGQEQCNMIKPGKVTNSWYI